MFLLGFDTETTGVDFFQSQVIQVGAVLCDVNLNEVAKKQWNINFDEENFTWTSEAEAVHGISKKTAMDHGVSTDTFIREFFEWISSWTKLKNRKDFENKVYIVGANCQFDYNMCKHSLYDMCTDSDYSFIPFSYRMLYDVNALGNFVVGKNSLGSLMNHFGIKSDETKRHSALYDAEMHIKVFRSILLADIARCKPN